MDTITTATPKQSPPANSLILPATAWFGTQHGVAQPVPLTQYDDTLPMLAVALYLNGQPYTVPDGAAINIRMDKRDGHYVYNPAYGLSDDRKTVYVAVTLQMTTGVGVFAPILELVVDGDIAGTSPLPLYIAKNPVPKDAVESTDEWKTIQQIAAEVEAAAQVVEDNAENLQWIKDNADTVQAVAGNADNINAVAGNAANINTVAGNAANINTVVSEMDAIKAAPTAATQAAGSAADAAQSAEDAQAAAQQALGFRTFFNAISPDEDGSLDPSRPMTTASAKAAWTVRSEGGMLQSVEVFGYTSGGAGAGADGKVTVTVQGHTDSSVDIPLTQQLLAGESVQSYVNSGCDAYIEFDGSEDENWVEQTAGDVRRYYIWVSGGAKDAYKTSLNPAIANWLKLTVSGGTGNTQNTYSFTIERGNLYIYTDGASLSDFKATLAENPLKLWYTAATPTGKKYYVSMERHAADIIYAHDQVEITADPYTDADTGVEPGTYTVSSEDGTTVKVTLKALTENAKADTAVQPGDILDLVYPVGSIYMSCNATSPGALFGGTWERIEGSFLFAADDQHQAGSTGGSAAVTLTAQNIPQMTGQLGYCDGGFVPANGYARSVIKSGTGGGGTVLEGKTGSLSDRDPTGYYDSSLVRVGTSSPSSISILPPYLAVYIWRRTA